MTEAEVIESLNLHAANSMDAYAIFVTFTFGYLTVAFFAGNRLSMSQVLIISILYVVSALAFSIVSLLHIDCFEVLVSNYPEYAHSIWWRYPWATTCYFLNIGGILASLYFMFEIRRRGDETEN
jgi:hypothetical protein